MGLNRLQIQIFTKLSSEKKLEIEDYLRTLSKQYIDRTTMTLEDLTEKEADTWITKAYLESLG